MPADGGVDTDPECSGQNCCRGLGGELEQCCAAGLVGADAEPVQSQLESFGADRAAGLASGKQPARRGGRSDGGVAFAGGDDGAGQLVDRVRQTDGCAAEADADPVIGDRDLVGGQQSDGRWALGVEEQQQAGQAVFGVDRGVVQQLAGDRPSLIVVERMDRTAPTPGVAGCGGRRW